MCCFSDNLDDSEPPTDLENQINPLYDVEEQPNTLPDGKSSTDDPKSNFGVCGTLFVSLLIIGSLLNVSYYWPASKMLSIGYAGISVFILSMVILVLKSPVYSRKYCHCITIIVLLLLIKLFLNKMWFGRFATYPDFHISNPPVTIYAGAWIEIGGLTAVYDESAYLQPGRDVSRLWAMDRNRIGRNGVVQLKASSTVMFWWETFALLPSQPFESYVVVDMRLVRPQPVYKITLTSENVKPTIILHGNRELSVHGLPECLGLNLGAYLNIAMPPGDYGLDDRDAALTPVSIANG
eukprot:1141042_1